ncbi:MAG: TonB-dependent receptor, partial [Acidobacteria bacterium]|nr:TonB-dependent receptor [Acidobacteriota bacterium]
INYNHGALGITGYLNSISFDGNYLLVTDANGQAGRWDGKSLAYHLEFGDSNTAGSKQLISYGGSLRHTQFKDLSFAPEAPNRTEGSAYLQDEILISNHFKWIVGVRIDKFNSLKGAVVSPRTMFMIKPVKTQAFRFSYNRAYLAPSVYWTHTNSYIMTRFDLGSIDPDLSGNFFNFPFCFCGNGDLEKQSLDAYEIGYTVFMVKNRINVGAAFYINDSEGDFYWPQTESYTSQNPPPGWPLPLEVLDALIAANAFGPGLGLPSVYKTANRGEVRNKGIELSTEIRFNRNITGYTNYSWQARPESEEFDVFSINLPPNHRFNAAADYNYSRYFGNVSFIYADKAYWNDILSALFSGSTKAYKVINITGGVRWGEGWKYTAMLRISNLANRLVQNHVYGDILRRQITGEFRMRF